MVGNPSPDQQNPQWGRWGVVGVGGVQYFTLDVFLFLDAAELLIATTRLTGYAPPSFTPPQSDSPNPISSQRPETLKTIRSHNNDSPTPGKRLKTSHQNLTQSVIKDVIQPSSGAVAHTQAHDSNVEGDHNHYQHLMTSPDASIALNSLTSVDHPTTLVHLPSQDSLDNQKPDCNELSNAKLEDTSDCALLQDQLRVPPLHSELPSGLKTDPGVSTSGKGCGSSSGERTSVSQEQHQKREQLISLTQKKDNLNRDTTSISSLSVSCMK
jgi:hypothetical protein